MVMNGADGAVETVPRQWVTAGFFDALGVTPIAGRTFRVSDDAERARVVVIAESFWRTRFGADLTAVGRDIRLDGSPYTVVGVVSDNAALLNRTSLWALVPLNRNPAARGARSVFAIGRMKPGITLAVAAADMSALAEGLSREFPDTNKGRGITLQPLRDAVIGGELRLTSLFFIGVVGCVLLICCTNVAHLLLTRATSRSHELAIRSALGADRQRLVRQLLTESLLLSAIGGVLGIGVGAAILEMAPAVLPQELLPAAVTLSLDMRVVGFTAGAALFVGLLCGLVPAWQATRFQPAGNVMAGGRSATSATGRIRSWLVGGEVAMAVLLLCGAGLLLRTVIAVKTVERGYRAEDALTMMVDPLGARYPSKPTLLQFFDRVEQEVARLPGINSVAWASTLPMGFSYAGRSSFEIAGGTPLDPDRRPTADLQIVSRSYFRTVDLPIVAGRGFTAEDTADAAPVCMVNEAFARAYGQGGTVIGQRLALRPASSPQAAGITREIVGVARQIKARPDEREDLVQIYVPMTQHVVDDIHLIVRPVSGSAKALAPSVRAAIARVDADGLVSVRNVMTLDDIAWNATARHWFRAVLAVTFAALAFVLALVGVFGVIASSLQQRVRELALRKALGATPRDLFRLVAGATIRVVVVGMSVGVFGAVLLSRVIATVLFAVTPLDPATFISVVVMFLVAVALAVAGPAWRAVRVDPAMALRGH
jgi:putative ABC transport system permease protein